MRLLLQSSFLLAIFYQVISQEVVSPASEEGSQNSGSSSSPNAENTNPEVCPKNMILHEEDESSTNMICDCKPLFLFNPEDNSCHEAFRQGPCPPEHYFVLPPGEISARCEKNPCLEDGLVKFQETCARLGESGPPCEDDLTKLSVEGINFELECAKPKRTQFLYVSRINAPVKDCPKGSRRILSGKCKRIFE